MTAFVLHKKQGESHRRVLFVDGLVLTEKDVTRDFTETFDEVIGLVSALGQDVVQVTDDHELRAALHREGHKDLIPMPPTLRAVATVEAGKGHLLSDELKATAMAHIEQAAQMVTSTREAEGKPKADD